MQPQDAEAHAGGSRNAHGAGHRHIGVRGAVAGGQTEQRRLEFGVRDPQQVLLDGVGRTDRRQTLFGTVVVLADVGLDQRGKEFEIFPRNGLVLDQYFAQRLLLGEHPGVHGRDQGLAVDEVHLTGQNAEKQIAVVLGRRHGFHQLKSSQQANYARSSTCRQTAGMTR